MKTMTSRQRVLAALNHEEPDKMPIDVGGLALFSCLHETAQKKLMNYLGEEEPNPELLSMTSRTVRPNKLIYEKFQSDCYGLIGKPSGNWELELVSDGVGGSWFYDEWGIKWHQPFGAFYYDAVEQPLRGASLNDVLHYKWPDPTDSARLASTKEQAKWLYENTDYCLVYTPIWATGIFQTAGIMQGFEDNLVNIMIAKDISRAMYEGLTEFHMAHLDYVMDEIGDYIQVIVMSDDLGFQDRPIIRVNLFQELLKPLYARIIERLKSRKPEIKVVFHTDGAVSSFLSEFIDIGIDATNPVQVSCAGMENTAKLKHDFGEKLSFWGAAVSSQTTLPFGTPQKVREEVRSHITDLAPGGGYIFASVHNIQPDVPVENMVATFEEAIAIRNYPIMGSKEETLSSHKQRI